MDGEGCHLGLMFPPVDVSTVPSCPHPLMAAFHQVPKFIYHSLLRFQRMVTLKKIPTSRVTDDKSMRTSCWAFWSKPNFPANPPIIGFSLFPRQTTDKKEKACFERICTHKTIFSSLFKARRFVSKPLMRERLGLGLVEALRNNLKTTCHIEL